MDKSDQALQQQLTKYLAGALSETEARQFEALCESNEAYAQALAAERRLDQALSELAAPLPEDINERLQEHIDALEDKAGIPWLWVAITLFLAILAWSGEQRIPETPTRRPSLREQQLPKDLQPKESKPDTRQNGRAIMRF